MFTDSNSVFGEFFPSSTASSASSSLPAFCFMLTLIPLLIAMSSGPRAVLATPQELTVYRMNNFDWQGVPYGSRSSVMNLELRTLSTLSQSFAKKCLLIKLDELLRSAETYKNLIKDPMVGGMLIIVPNSFANLDVKSRSSLLSFEKQMAFQVIDIPVYFAKENSDLINIYQELIKGSGDAELSKKSTIFNSILANGYQLSIPGPVAKPINDPVLTNIEAKFSGNKADDQSPTIVIAAHYDAFGIAPGLSVGADSNGSGVVALLEIARLFSKLYNNHKSQPSINLVFLLSAAGKFSFYGTKKWIEDHLDNRETGLLTDAHLTICLDSLGASSNNGAHSLYVHLPRIPKENSIASRFYNSLSEIASNSGVNVTFVPEKTYLSDDPLNWEHERFILRRLPALTLSSLKSPKSLLRTSISDTVENVSVNPLITKIEIIAEALSRLVFNLHNHSATPIFKKELGVSKQFVNSIINQITSVPRSQQMLLTTVTGSTYKVSSMLSTLHAILKRSSKETRLHHFRFDRKEPEIVFYEPTVLSTNIYNIKPAVFDLFLSFGIIFYLGILYLFLVNYQRIQTFVKSIKSLGESRQNGNLPNKGNKLL